MESKNYIYKFMPINRFSLYSLINKEIYFADPAKLNDPIDCLPHIKITNYNKLMKEDIIPFISKNRQHITWNTDFSDTKFAEDFLKNERSFLNFFRFIVNKENKNKIGICSFTNNCLDQRLWSHYADASKGVCLKFDKQILAERMKVNTGIQIPYLRVFYGENVNYDDKPFEMEILNGDFPIPESFYFKKTQVWDYEKEFRYILKVDRGISQNSYDEKNRFFGYGEALVEIILGENCSYQDIKTMSTFTKNSNILLKFLARDDISGKTKISSNRYG